MTDVQAVIIQNIIGHPEQLITFDELDYFNPSVSTKTLRAQLGMLVDKNAVARLETDNGVFYGLTREYRDELEKSDYVLRSERTLQEATLMTRLTPEIKKKMNLERPEWEPANPLGGNDD